MQHVNTIYIVYLQRNPLRIGIVGDRSSIPALKEKKFTEELQNVRE